MSVRVSRENIFDMADERLKTRRKWEERLGHDERCEVCDREVEIGEMRLVVYNHRTKRVCHDCKRAIEIKRWEM